MVQAQPDLEVMETASDENTLRNAVQLHRPDVVLADLDLQYQHQLHFLQQMYRESGVPALVLLDQEFQHHAPLRYAAGSGVYDYVLKPAHRLQPSLRAMQPEILEKIRAIRRQPMPAGFRAQYHSVLEEKKNFDPKGLVVIGASTGGTQAIEKIVSKLDEKLDACVIIAVHLPAGFTASFARRLQTLTNLKVVEGKTGTRLMKGKIIIAPGGKNMIVHQHKSVSGYFKTGFAADEASIYDRPSIDRLMTSVAALGFKNTLGVVLTGMGADGTQGLKAIQKAGGVTVAQDQASSVIFGMAKSAIEQGCVSNVLSLFRVPAFINKFITDIPAAVAKPQPGF